MTNNTSDQFKYKRVMIIDDNIIDRYICERLSKKYSFSEQVVSIDSAKNALTYLNSLKETPDLLPELIFLDINMPKMNGFQFLEAYNELPEVIKKNCIIVMLTTSIHPEDHARATASKYVRGYLNKPLNKEKFGEL